MRLYSYLATLLFLGFGLTYYTRISPWHGEVLNRTLGFQLSGNALHVSIFNIYIWVIIAYAIVLPFYYRNSDGESKALIVARACRAFMFDRRRLSDAESLAARILLLKFFFAPLMVSWLAQHLSGFFDLSATLNGAAAASMGWMELYNKVLHAKLIHLVIFFDVFFFTIGYMVDHPKLKNTFVSVDPTLSGWLVCIICYPPFNLGLKSFIGWYSTDSPAADAVGVQFALNLAVLLTFVVYSAASLSLGFKASNLTNRGIVDTGVYRFIRHPAYTFKNLAWWLGAMPVLWLAVQRSPLEVVAILLSLCGWTTIYIARALTEERHLLMTDNGYREYMQRVPYRFIPGIV
jgi:protein-S-isoprenylcysteine O-methyltransferase Ste14